MNITEVLNLIWMIQNGLYTFYNGIWANLHEIFVVGQDEYFFFSDEQRALPNVLMN